MNDANFRMRMLRNLCICITCAVLCVPHTGGAAGNAAPNEYYTEPPLYQLRPDPNQEEILFGNVGVSGLLINFHKGAVVTVDKTLPDTPAAGKFTSGQIITGVNGETFAGRNPYCILGAALTKAEATDGNLVFTVKDNPAAPEKKVTVTIHVLGAYSDTWPLNDEKSKKIIAAAAKYYSSQSNLFLPKEEGDYIGSALACLFLLSTGDDQYLPIVKKYFQQYLPSNAEHIGHHTWNNGYNGVACAEYYLRTGDTNVLPIIQYYCDDAALRQMFGYGWGHWGLVPHPRYTCSGLMNPAGAQVLTTLLLAKECGVNVDQGTLMGALRFFYRFAGHGSVAYGDHRPEGGLGSNGKDGMIAAAMQVATDAAGDVAVYRRARNHLSMSMIHSYPCLVQGHGDWGRGDALWRGLASVYTLEDKPAVYHEAMNRLTWFYDLCRRPSGALGVPGCPSHDEPGSGAGVALTYTAPLKTLRITGAPRSKYAKPFALPAQPWGTKADTAFLSVDKNPKFAEHGTNEPVHVPFYALGSAYGEPKADLKAMPKSEILKCVYHDNYVIRAQAAKALRRIGAFKELEDMLGDPDPRVRRAALDGIIDYKYWFQMGKDVLPEKDMSPKMIAAIEKILTDTNEAWWVVDGALMAMSLAPPAAIDRNLPAILPWLKHQEWWLRESAFHALSGMTKDEKLLPKALPPMLDMVAAEYHTMPHERCLSKLDALLARNAKEGPIREQLLAGLLRAVKDGEIKPDRGLYRTSAEGAHNVKQTVNAYLSKAPETGLSTAQLVSKRLDTMSEEDIVDLIDSPHSKPTGKPRGLYTCLDALPPTQRTALVEILYTVYRTDLMKRLATMTDGQAPVIDTIIDLLRLKHPDAGWHVLGSQPPADRMWRYTSFDPLPKDAMKRREHKRFRDVTLPAALSNWYAPAFDDHAWHSGHAPIGVGSQKGASAKTDPNAREQTFANRSPWGDGEFLVMRTTFDLDDTDYDFVRLRLLMKQGYHIYLNGHKIHTYVWWQSTRYYESIMLGPDQVKHLKKGTNVLSAYANIEYTDSYPPNRRATVEGDRIGLADVYLEGLRKSDLEAKK